MEIKKCLNNEVPTPSNGTGYFYLDQETNKLKLKKSTETISWDLVGVDKYKDVDAETARLCHILENDDTEGYACKQLVQFTSSTTEISLFDTDYSSFEKLINFSLIKTSDGSLYDASNPNLLSSHIFSENTTDKYVIVYYESHPTMSTIYTGYILDGDMAGNCQKINRVLFLNWNIVENNSNICRFCGYAGGIGTYLAFAFINCDFSQIINAQYMFWEERIENFYVLNDTNNNTLNLTSCTTLYGVFWMSAFNFHGKIDAPNCTVFSHFFLYCPTLNICPEINTSNGTDFSRMFSDAGITTVPLLDLSNANNCDCMFENCESLRYLGGFKGLKVDLSLADSPLLVKASLLNVLNNLADVTELGTEPKLLLAINIYSKLTDDEIAIATNKGWSILICGGSN